ncbi:MAG: carbohydrate kinase family protein [Victivallaceae bacterium]|nr:carbohydrate kinase family protein [Victivallaceae bacterium]
MERNGIIGAGNWIVDHVKTIDRWPGEGNLCNILSQIAAPGGGPANVLFDLAAMDGNLPLYAAGLLGDDEDGEYLLGEIASRRIDASFMGKTRSAATSFTDAMSGEGKRTFFHCRGANALLDRKTLEKVDVPAKFFYLGYLLLLDALDAPDERFGTRAAGLLKSLKDKGYRTVVDFVSEAPEKFRRIVFPSLPFIDILIVNEVEAGACCGFDLRCKDGALEYARLPEAVDFLFSKGVGETAVIHFPEGAAGRTKDGAFVYAPSCAIRKSEIVGSTGAGDAFCAGVMYALHQDWPLDEALKLGAASSNFNLRDATASGGAVSLEKMMDFLKTCEFGPMPPVKF